MCAQVKPTISYGSGFQSAKRQALNADVQSMANKRAKVNTEEVVVAARSSAEEKVDGAVSSTADEPVSILNIHGQVMAAKLAQKPKKFMRAAAGEVWEDPSMADWPENDFRLFAGDLGNEVNDNSLIKLFSKYPSFARAKVIRSKKTQKTKGWVNALSLSFSLYYRTWPLHFPFHWQCLS